MTMFIQSFPIIWVYNSITQSFENIYQLSLSSQKSRICIEEKGEQTIRVVLCRKFKKNNNKDRREKSTIKTKWQS